MLKDTQTEHFKSGSAGVLAKKIILIAQNRKGPDLVCSLAAILRMLKTHTAPYSLTCPLSCTMY